MLKQHYIKYELEFVNDKEHFNDGSEQEMVI